MAQLITKLNIVFVIIFSFFLFHEERAVIRSPSYLGGTLLSLVGVAAVLAKDPASLVPIFDRAAALLLGTAVCWGVYMVWSKHLVMGMHPIPMFTVVSIYTTLGLGILSLTLGEPGTLIAAGPRLTAVAFISGLLPIALAHPAFHFAQRTLGSAFSNSCNLLTPLLTYLFGVTVLVNERLTRSQWLGAAMLIAGTALVTFALHRTHRRAATAAPAPPD
jgi:drug/metabolite transporter (DMT)-like permease